MREFPVFVPFEDAPLAATLTVPDGDPRAVVLLLAGTGAPRSHRFQLWTRTARVLAERGLASIRLDYKGIGDSGGRAPQDILGDFRLDQALAAARFGMEACSLDRFAVVGNCSGGVIGLGVAAQVPECEAAVLILARLVVIGGVSRAAIEVRKSRLGAMVRKHPWLRRAVHKTLKGRRDLPTPMMSQSFNAALDHSKLLFMYSEHDKDPYVSRSQRLLEHMVKDLPARQRSRVDTMTITEGPLAGFESQVVQQRVIDSVVEWMARSLRVDERGADRTRTDATAGAFRPR